MDDLETFDARSFVTRMLGLGENLFIVVFLAPLLLKAFAASATRLTKQFTFPLQVTPKVSSRRFRSNLHLQLLLRMR
jgi:hypothetical protein